MARYWFIDKSNAQSNIQSALNSLQELFSQESEVLIANSSLEVEGFNTISCPPHFAKLINAVKFLKEVEKCIEGDEFQSFPVREQE